MPRHPLQTAAAHGNLQSVRALLQRTGPAPASVRAAALRAAIRAGHQHVARELLLAAATPVPPLPPASVLAAACSARRNVTSMVKLAVHDQGADPTAPDPKTGLTALMAVCASDSKGSDEAARWLLGCGRGVSANRECALDGRTALHHAAASRCSAAQKVSLLLRRGAVPRPDRAGATPLMLAVCSKHLGKRAFELCRQLALLDPGAAAQAMFHAARSANAAAVDAILCACPGADWDAVLRARDVTDRETRHRLASRGWSWLERHARPVRVHLAPPATTAPDARLPLAALRERADAPRHAARALQACDAALGSDDLGALALSYAVGAFGARRVQVLRTGQVGAIAALPDGRLATCDHAACIRIYGARDDETVVLRPPEPAGPEFKTSSRYVLASVGQDRLARAGHGPDVVVYDLRTHRLAWRLEGHGAEVRHLASLPDGRRLVAATAGGAIVVWDVVAGTCEQRCALPPCALTALCAVARDAVAVATSTGADRHQVNVLDLPSAKFRAAALCAPAKRVTSVAVLCDGRLGCLVGGARVVVVDPRSRQAEGVSFGVHVGAALVPLSGGSVAFDGGWVWNGRTGSTAAVVDVASGACRAAAALADGRLAAVVRTRTADEVVVWQ